jgi:hypothetical protein
MRDLGNSACAFLSAHSIDLGVKNEDPVPFHVVETWGSRASKILFHENLTDSVNVDPLPQILVDEILLFLFMRSIWGGSEASYSSVA